MSPEKSERMRSYHKPRLTLWTRQNHILYLDINCASLGVLDTVPISYRDAGARYLIFA
jgi:hypothetical protein